MGIELEPFRDDLNASEEARESRKLGLTLARRGLRACVRLLQEEQTKLEGRKGERSIAEFEQESRFFVQLAKAGESFLKIVAGVAATLSEEEQDIEYKKQEAGALSEAARIAGLSKQDLLTLLAGGKASPGSASAKEQKKQERK